jgi:SET domain-containing protein
MGLLIRSSKIHAAGCFTTAPLPKGAYIVEYTGELITAVEADRRYADSDHTLLFGLSDGETVIDGRGLAAFINHSCEPNCEPDEIDGRIWIVALRDIAAGEELTYDYNLYDGDGHAPCNCGAKHCRGTMYQIDSPKRRRRGGGNKTKRKKTARRRKAA